MRMIQQSLLTCGKTLEMRRLLIAQHARQEAHDRIDQHHRGQLAAAEHVIADADRFEAARLFADGVDDALVERFVVAGEQDEALALGELFDLALGERLALRGHDDARGSCV